ncbi:hypothetical protein Ddye_031548 [Dipteronia dyeriana]|uniref:Reverse transcriptase domain-containing protein n=1 Tax=Dipteronia dyeriana TaxID=168575 RepID=A0AAD9TJ61_9ROSI|nr:hypothetical protein Ddye_031548 [Dipteronia dyeriana]
MKLMQAFYEDEAVIEDLNYTFIALILKTKCPVNLKEYRPFSLIGSFYKVLEKVLANRLKIVMNSIIGQSQMAFIKGRRIVDSFVIADDQWKKDGKGGLLVKLDFEKAYDNVNHAFLLEVLSRMGFGEKWMEWIKCFSNSCGGCLETGKASAAFFWNDSHMRRKIDSVDWDTLCKHKKHGGLGIGKMRDKGLSLMAKCSWRLGREESSLLKNVLCAKYGLGDKPLLWDCCKAWRICVGWWDVCACSLSLLKDWVLGWKALCPSNAAKRSWNILFFFAIIWTIWESRNEVIFHGLAASDGKTLDMIKFRVALWFKNYGCESEVDLTMLMLDLQERCVDSGSAKVIRSKSWVPSAAYNYCFYVNGLSRGIYAIHRACQLLIDKQVCFGYKITIFSDSNFVVAWCNGEEFDNFNLIHLVHDIRHILQSWEGLEIKFLPRELNSFADCLAKDASGRCRDRLEWGDFV